MFRPLAKHLPFLAMLGVVFFAGYRGIDFGGHWDERRMMTNVYQTMARGQLLPQWYNYPSLSFDLVMLSVLPEPIVCYRNRGAPASDPFGQDLARRAFDPRTAVRARGIFLFVTLLSVVWVYLAALKWNGRWPEALLAAALVGGSFEVSYHARWIAPDGLVMQFAALSLLTTALMHRRKGRKTMWLWITAAVAGLATGSKYPGGILVVPVVIYAVAAGREARRHGGATWPPLAGALVAFVLAFVATTPGALVEPTKFMHDIVYEAQHYSTGHEGYSVSPFVVHGVLMVQYLALNAFSMYWPLALAFFAFAIVGKVFVIREDPRFAWLLVFVPVLYFVFVSTQRVMLVRNLLMLLPCLAVLAAYGVSEILRRIRLPRVRAALATAVTLAVGINLASIVSASNTVFNKESLQHVEYIAAYLAKHKDKKVFISQIVRSQLDAATPPLRPTNVTESRDEAERFLIHTRDAFDRKKWPGNRFGRWHVVSGPRDINFDYYPTWGGNPHIVAIAANAAADLGPIRGERSQPRE
jgi:4-amino-4-deoxy-L-arabinose transferase-like glycosyltransferase